VVGTLRDRIGPVVIFGEQFSIVADFRVESRCLPLHFDASWSRDADGAEIGDARGGALVLPADHGRDRRHAARVLGQCGAVLVHDADPREVAGRDAGLFDRADA
jgi:hypothetical protein